MVFDQDLGTWRAQSSLSRSQLPHPSQGPILAPAPKSKSAPRRGSGIATSTKAQSKNRATPRRSRPEEFDLQSEMTWQSDEVDETFLALDEQES